VFLSAGRGNKCPPRAPSECGAVLRPGIEWRAKTLLLTHGRSMSRTVEPSFRDRALSPGSLVRDLSLVEYRRLRSVFGAYFRLV